MGNIVATVAILDKCKIRRAWRVDSYTDGILDICASVLLNRMEALSDRLAAAPVRLSTETRDGKCMVVLFGCSWEACRGEKGGVYSVLGLF